MSPATSKPVLLSVDDDPEVLRAIERDLRQHYSENFRVVRASSGASALSALEQLKVRNSAVALLLVDQRMPQMNGVEFLEKAIELYPDAKRVLLTAYADTDAAIRAINTARIDYYLLKPWDPPGERLYPVLDDLIEDWQASYHPPFEGVRVVGHRWSPKAFEVRDFLARHQVPYRWHDVEADPVARELLELLVSGASKPARIEGNGKDAGGNGGPPAPAAPVDGGASPAPSGKGASPALSGEGASPAPSGKGALPAPFPPSQPAAAAPASPGEGGSPAPSGEGGWREVALPVVFFADGTHLSEPTRAALAERIGMRTRAESRFYDLVIAGGGPAGLAAAVYGASEGLRTLMIEQNAPGGQAGTSSRIENYLGFPSGLSGADLARRAVSQAVRFGVEIVTPQEATGVRLEDPYRIVTLSDGSEVSCHALLVATGVSYRKLDVPGIAALEEAGVYYGAALTEAMGCRGEDVYLVGGANSAGQAAMYLSRYASRVVMLVRASSLSKGMSHYLVEQIAQTPNITVRPHTTVVGVHGEGRLEAIDIADAASGATETVLARALFIFIGAAPRTNWLEGVVARDSNGFVLSGPELMHDAQRPPGWTLDRDPFLLETNVPGIFVAGDVRRGSVKRVASGVGEGSIAISFIHQHLARL